MIWDDAAETYANLGWVWEGEEWKKLPELPKSANRRN
jgi:hypothetical protein